MASTLAMAVLGDTGCVSSEFRASAQIASGALGNSLRTSAICLSEARRWHYQVHRYYIVARNY